MVRFLEHQGKEMFSKYGINVPRYQLVRAPEEIGEIKSTSFVKAQVPTGHRGEHGGVIKVTDRTQAVEAVKKIMGTEFDGYKPESFIIEEAIEHSEEFYMSMTLDRSHRLPVVLSSKKGGIDIEKIPDAEISKDYINPFIGTPAYLSRNIAQRFNLSADIATQLSSVLNGMFAIYKKEDAELVEINPLVVSGKRLVALDAKIIIEDDAMFRHKDIKDESGIWMDPMEREAKKKGISFVRLGGKIGVIANGAGLTMATLDVLKLNGGDPGDFLDLGGTDDPEKILEAFELINKTNPSVLFVNIFGGVTKCDVVAEGLVSALDRFKPKFSMVVRLRGFREKEGIELFRSRGINSYSDMDEAIKKVVEISRGSK